MLLWAACHSVLAHFSAIGCASSIAALAASMSPCGGLAQATVASTMASTASPNQDRFIVSPPVTLEIPRRFTGCAGGVGQAESRQLTRYRDLAPPPSIGRCHGTGSQGCSCPAQPPLRSLSHEAWRHNRRQDVPPGPRKGSVL